MARLKSYKGALHRFDCRCLRCGHTWTSRPRADVPIVCPGCTTPYWNRPRLDRAPDWDRGRD